MHCLWYIICRNKPHQICIFTKENTAMKKALIFLLAVMFLSSILPVAWAEDPLIRLFGEGEADVLGKPFPDFTVKDTKKNEFTLSEALKDHEAVLINFFASWCGPCIRALPLLNELYKQ